MGQARVRRAHVTSLLLILLSATIVAGQSEIPPVPSPCEDPSSAECQSYLIETADAAARAVLEACEDPSSAECQAYLQEAADDAGREVNETVDGAVPGACEDPSSADCHALIGETAEAAARDALLTGPYTVWTSLNHGEGSGLDADLLDGASFGDILAAVDAASGNAQAQIDE
ncbi:MAG: hypothetical protein ACT4PT_12715 [Methanobacteriota archaeon]